MSGSYIGRKAYIGAQNDALFIIHGEPPAQSNDHPRHDADRKAMAKVFDEAACRRLVACWNACDGIATDVLVAIPGITGPMVSYHELKAERDALLAALESEQEWRAREADGAIDPEWDYERMVGEKRRAAIAKATGSQP